MEDFVLHYEKVNKQKFHSKLHVRVTNQLFERLQSLAHKKELKVSDLVREAIRIHFGEAELKK